MSKTKHLVHKVKVTEMGERIYFQVRIPEGTKKVLGVHATINIDDGPLTGNILLFLQFIPGALTIAHPTTSEIAYSQSLWLPLRKVTNGMVTGLREPNYEGLPAYVPSEGFEPSLSVNWDTPAQLLECFYQDNNTKHFSAYQLRLYLTFEIEDDDRSLCN